MSSDKRNEAEQTPARGPRRPKDWSADEKLRVVLEAAGLSAEEVGALLRREGLHEADLTKWREAAVIALSGDGPRRSKASGSAKRIRQLERELRRKDKALAEAAALLVLQKKVQAIWGDEDDDTEPKNGG